MLMLKYVVLWHRKVNINKFLSLRRALLFTILKRLNSVTLCFINRELTLNDAMRRMDDKFREFRDRSINAEHRMVDGMSSASSTKTAGAIVGRRAFPVSA